MIFIIVRFSSKFWWCSLLSGFHLSFYNVHHCQLLLAYDEFYAKYPEGEINQEQFMEVSKVELVFFYDSDDDDDDDGYHGGDDDDDDNDDNDDDGGK